MATYTISHTLQNSTSYPAAEFSSTFAPLTSVYFKLDDTIQATVSHPVSGNTLGISLNDVNEANPDPSNLNGTFTHQDDYTYSLTWSGTFAEGGTASTDFFTQWFHFNRTGTFQYSAKSVFRRVSVASLSMGSTTIAPGGSTTITANTIQGLLPPTGNNAHRLYLYVTDTSDNMLFGNGPTFSVSGNNTWLGKFTTTQTTNTMTVGSGVADGDYRLHVGHYGGGGSGNVFYGSDHRLTSIDFTVETVASDADPVAFNLGNDRSSVSLNAQIQADQITVTGIDVPAQISVTGTSDGSGGILGSPRYSIAGGTYTSNAGTVNNNQTVDFRFDAPGSYGQSRTCGLSIGSGPGRSDSLTVTTLVNPGPGGSTPPAGTGTVYGLEVLNSNGAVVFGPNLRSSHIVRTGGSTANSGTISPLNAGQSQIIGPVEGFAFNNASTITVFALATSTTSSGYGAYEINITRGSNSNGIGEGKFRIQNPSSTTNLDVTYFVVRF